VINVQLLIFHDSAGSLGTAASLLAALAIPNMTLLEAPWANREPETDIAGGAPVALSGDRGRLRPAAGEAGAGD
jgi:hypothetical protein